MILVDTSIWVEHLRSGDAELGRLLERGSVLGHPWIAGELALGRLRRREEILGLIGRLPQATLATAGELLAFIEHHSLYGLGIGYVDAQLLASTRLIAGARLWTRDHRLGAAAVRMRCSYEPAAAQGLPPA